MIEKLRQLKKKSHMTNQQIAEKSNIPESTVARIFSGKTPNPTVTTVVAMTRAMGGSPADLMNDVDLKNAADDLSAAPEQARPDGEAETAAVDSASAQPHSDDNAPEAPGSDESEFSAQNARIAEMASAHEKIYEDILNLYKAELKKKEKWIVRLFWCLAGIMAFILFILIFDILHPNFGFVKY